MPAKTPSPTAKLRECHGRLKNGRLCHKEFLSEGPWNQICPACNGRNDRLPPSAPRGRNLLRRTVPPQRGRAEMER